MSCNPKLGRDLEASAKSDPSVLMAAKNLSSQIPSLAKTLVESHPHVGQSEPGLVQGFIRNDEFRVRSMKLDDGSLIQPTDEAKKSVSRILKKSGCGEAPIQKAIDALDKAPEDIKIEVAPGLGVVKWSIQRLELDLNKAQIMDSLIPAKTAFEFLACHAGAGIYDDAYQLSEIRNSLICKEINLEAIKVERLSSNKYEPFHGLCFEGNDPYAKVQIRLFGWLAFRIHFFHLSISGPRFIYTHKLDTNKEQFDTNN